MNSEPNMEKPTSELSPDTEYEKWKRYETRAKKQVVGVTIGILVWIGLWFLLGCSDSPTDVPCDENSPDWPECHEQGQGEGGQ